MAQGFPLFSFRTIYGMLTIVAPIRCITLNPFDRFNSSMRPSKGKPY